MRLGGYIITNSVPSVFFDVKGEGSIVLQDKLKSTAVSYTCIIKIHFKLWTAHNSIHLMTSSSDSFYMQITFMSKSI